ncbi:hypothetical protein BK377_20840 [Escherichia coli]|mgnify:FL=1|nr:hypothetical protein [Salmonella enterica subsp. enterica serovar Typhimurium]OJR14930.1 hypothetical protein BK377_20840 [Escherichia coli]OWE22302.1 hypothetical protein A8M43_25470 [Escherichia coli]
MEMGHEKHKSLRVFMFDLYDALKAKIIGYTVWKAVIVLSTLSVGHVMAIGFVIFMGFLLIRELKR